MKNYYEILGIESNASFEDVRKAYKALAIKFHPDLNDDDKAAATFILIKEAYDVLSVGEKRNDYDARFKEYFKQTNGVDFNFKELLINIKALYEKSQKVNSDNLLHRRVFEYLLLILTLEHTEKIGSIQNDPLKVEFVSYLVKCIELIENEKHPIQGFLYLDFLMPRIETLVGKDEKSVDLIRRYKNGVKTRNGFIKFAPWAILSFIPLFLVFFYIKKSNKGEKIKTDIHKQSEVIDTRVWTHLTLENGDVPECYEVNSKHGHIENYLDVKTGNTEVALKLVNANTDECIRFIYVNKNSHFKIEGIPQAIYYLKIAYGENWVQSIEDGKCVGKFQKAIHFEKSLNPLNYFFVESSDVYEIPSYSLELNVLADRNFNSYEAVQITSGQFDK